MSIFKKIFSGSEDESGVAKTDAPQRRKTRGYGTPDYSLYVNIGPNDGIFRVSLTDRIKSDFKDIYNQYELARKFYGEAERRPAQIRDFRKSFDALSRTFELIAIWLCNKNKLPVDGKDVFEVGKLLDERVFNRDQANVLNGILALIDKYEGNNIPVTDYDVKTHFISLGIIVKIFKEAVLGKSIYDVPCTFQKMREKIAAKQRRKAEEKKIDRELAADPNLAAIMSIEREYSVAKNCLHGNKVNQCVLALENTVTMATRRICKLTDVSLKEKGKRKDIESLNEELLYCGYVRTTYFDVVKAILQICSEHPDGKGLKKEFVQGMLQRVGSTVMPTLREMSSQNTRRKKILPDLVAPLFRNMGGNNNEGDQLYNRYPEISDDIKKANLRLEEGEFDDALHTLRGVMELIAENLCKKYNLYFDSKPTLENRIDAIVHSANFTNNQRDVMHKARILGNKGSHRQTEKATASDVTYAMELVNKSIAIFREEMFGVSGGSNSPKFDPDYYNNTRRYYGRWCKVFNQQDLRLNMDYVKLERRANANDIEAMLDIANGFLSNRIEWDANSLVFAPKSSLYANIPDRYDARYYYWILKACDTAYNLWVSGDDIPLTYIATALVEGMKFLCCHQIAINANRVASSQNTIYTLAERMFGGKMLSGTTLMINMANMLICMFEEYGEGDENGSIVAPAQGDVRIHNIKWYVYLYHKLCDENAEVSLCSRLLINEDDIGKTYAEVYKKYTNK